MGSQQDYGMRIYDPRVGRFLSVDPISKDYPELTPYQFASNKPIEAIDLDGLEEYSMSSHHENLKRDGELLIKKLENTTIYNLGRVPNVPFRSDRLSQAAPPKNALELHRWKIVQEREYEKVGYNSEGNPKPLTRLAKNKTWNAFADNLALPMLEGYSYLSGLGELRALSKAVSFLGKTEFKALAKAGTIDANTIRFSQDNIAATFTNGKDVQSLINSLKSGQKINMEPIRIVENNGMVFTLDNRRLYAYQQASVEIPYIKLDKIPKKELDKFTTTNMGTSIEVRKPKTK